MFSIARSAAVVGATVLVSTIVLADGSSKAVEDDGVESTILREEDKVFTPQFGPVEFADAFGSRETGPHGTYGLFPGGFVTPPHIHSHGYRAVVLKGTMSNPFEGEENAPVMEPGSFWSVKAGELHTTACVSDTACEFLMWGDQGFDFIAEE